jgi:hypothetical protein
VFSHPKREYWVMAFENKVLRRTFVCKREEITGGWRNVPNKKLHYFHSSPNIIRMIRSKGSFSACGISEIRMQNLCRKTRSEEITVFRVYSYVSLACRSVYLDIPFHLLNHSSNFL